MKRFYGGPTTTTSPSSSSSTSSPWAPTIPGLQNVYAQAAQMYANGPTQYTPWSQAATLTPDQQAQINGTANYVNSAGTQSLMNQGSNAVQNLMTGANNPYTSLNGQTASQLAGYQSNNTADDPSQGLNNFMYQNMSDPTLQNAVSSASSQSNAASAGINGLVQNGFGFGQNMASNLGAIGQNNAIDTALGSAFDSQNANRLSAANTASGIQNSKANLNSNLQQAGGTYANDATNLGNYNYSNVINSPLSMLGQLNTAGAANQSQAQAQLTNATNAWNFAQQAPYNNLARFAALTTPNNAWGNTSTNGTTTTTTPSSGSGAGIGSIAGMAAAGIAAPFTGGASLAYLPLAGTLGGTAGGLLSGGK